MDLHDLTAGYALDALDVAERQSYEEHLRSCERCREELQGFQAVSGALAYAAGGPAPPPALRARIIEQARAERSNVVPLRSRFRLPVLVLAPVAAAAAAAAVALGFWIDSLSDRVDRLQRENAVLGDPRAQTLNTSRGEASLVVTPSGDAALVVRTLAPAPEGKDYEIWVFKDGVPHRAGLFERPGVALLTRKVAPGQLVAVTVEQDGGVDAPTGAPLFTATRA